LLAEEWLPDEMLSLFAEYGKKPDFLHEPAGRRSARAEAPYGVMFWLMWKRLLGSYFRLT
jgi:hypothetical protein